MDRRTLIEIMMEFDGGRVEQQPEMLKLAVPSILHIIDS